VRLPFLAVWKVPLLGSLAPARFSLYVGLATILALAAASDTWSMPASRLRRSGCALLAAGIVIPLLPAWPYAYVPRQAPDWFEHGGYRAIPRGAVLETYPVARHRYGSPTSSSPVEWQALAGFWYRTTGGYVIARAPDGRSTRNGGVTEWERAVTAAATAGAVPPEQLARVRAEWSRLGVAAVAVDPTARGAGRVDTLMVQLTGRVADSRRLDMDVWKLR
jgi:hypothetical protein